MSREATPYLYEVTADRFREHCDLLRSRALVDRVQVTFDDGHASNVTIAAPVLDEYTIRATFFVTTDWIGREPYVRPEQVSELARRGHKVQSHSASHAFLSTLDDHHLSHELMSSKQRLESITGSPVTEIAAPGGRWNARVARAAAAAGYQRLYTSDRWNPRTVNGGIEVIPRVMVTRHTSCDTILRWLSPSLAERATGILKERAKLGVRALLGETGYQRVWRLLAGAPKEMN
jgi:peptidoglycan/xylan/chitin deacetylase (PgdA/CDA1 family)